MNGLYHHPPTWLHKIGAGYKLAALAALSIFAFHVSGLTLMLCGLVATIAIYAALGRDVLRRLTFVAPLWPVLAIIFIAQYFTVGAGAASLMICRLLLMLLLADLVTMSTPMQAMMDAIIPVLSPLRFAGANTSKISFAAALTIRLVPLLLENWRSHAEAWRARTGKRPGWRLLAPFVANSLLMADRMGEALDARGFGAAPTVPLQHKDR